MDSKDLIQAFYAALDSQDMSQADQYLSEDYRLVDFTQQPMDRNALLELLSRFKKGLPNFRHSLSNIREEGNVVKVTVQGSGTNSGHIDLSHMGIGVIPRSMRFIIFPNSSYEFTIQDEKITVQRDVSPNSPNRRMSGMLKALGVNVAAL